LEFGLCEIMMNIIIGDSLVICIALILYMFIAIISLFIKEPTQCRINSTVRSILEKIILFLVFVKIVTIFIILFVRNW
jgi:hypothetical protein